MDTSTGPSEDTWLMGFIPQNFTIAQDFCMQLLNLLHWLGSLSISYLEQSVKKSHFWRPSRYLHFYHSVPSWGLVLHLKKKAKIVVLNTLPTAFLLRLLPLCGLPGPLHPESAQVLQPIPSIATPTCWVGCFRQTLSLSYKVKRSEYLTCVSIKQFLAKSGMLLPASSCDFWLSLTPLPLKINLIQEGLMSGLQCCVVFLYRRWS